MQLQVIAKRRNDGPPGAERAIFMLSLWGLKPERWELALQLHIQPSGFSLHPHVDGYRTQMNLWILLWPARAGGRLLVDGPVRSWLWGRIKLFDGACEHYLTEVLGGPRVLLMLYAARGSLPG